MGLILFRMRVVGIGAPALFDRRIARPGGFFIVDRDGLAIEVMCEVAKLPLGLWVSGAVGNIATFVGAFAECVRV